MRGPKFMHPWDENTERSCCRYLDARNPPQAIESSLAHPLTTRIGTFFAIQERNRDAKSKAIPTNPAV